MASPATSLPVAPSAAGDWIPDPWQAQPDPRPDGRGGPRGAAGARGPWPAPAPAGLWERQGVGDSGRAGWAASREPLRSQAEPYKPLCSRAEAFVPKSLALAGCPRPQLGGTDPKASKYQFSSPPRLYRAGPIAECSIAKACLFRGPTSHKLFCCLGSADLTTHAASVVEGYGGIQLTPRNFKKWVFLEKRRVDATPYATLVVSWREAKPCFCGMDDDYRRYWPNTWTNPCPVRPPPGPCLSVSTVIIFASDDCEKTSAEDFLSIHNHDGYFDSHHDYNFYFKFIHDEDNDINHHKFDNHVYDNVADVNDNDNLNHNHDGNFDSHNDYNECDHINIDNVLVDFKQS